MLDDASSESFVNEEVVGRLGFESKKANNASARSMPLQIGIENVDGQFTKTMDIQTCSKAERNFYKKN